jgi:hypothetical protein
MLPIMDATTSILGSLGSLTYLWAYLDPGAGSMILQILLAGMLSSMFFVKNWIRQIRDSLLVRDRKA